MKSIRDLITKFILLEIVILWSISKGHGQKSNTLDTPIVIAIKNTKAQKAVKLIANSIDYNFSYNASLLKNRKVNLISEKITPRNALFQIFEDSSLIIAQIDQNIIIYKNTVSKSTLHISEKEKNIVGKVIDEVTLQSVPYASIRGVTLDYFTSTNKDGLFSMPSPIADSTLFIISSLGYTPTKWYTNTNKNSITIPLKSNATTLKEVIIRSVSPELALKQSLNATEKNFPITPSNAKAFFREVIYREEKPVAISEASLELYKQAYNNDKIDKVRLTKGRRFADSQLSDSIALKLKGSLKSCLSLDIAKKTPPFYSLKNKGYQYTYKDVLSYDEGLVYKIDFEPNNLVSSDFYSGSIYLDESTYALKRVSFEVKPKYLKRAQSTFINKKPLKTSIKFIKANYHIQYRTLDSITYISYVRLESTFKLGKKGSFKFVHYRTQAELSIGEVNLKTPTSIPNSELFIPDEIFLEQPINYENQYWEGHNFLPLDVYLHEAIKESDF